VSNVSKETKENSVRKLLRRLRAGWGRLPKWLRGALRDAVVALIALGYAFTWHVPTNLTDVSTQAVAFWVVAVPVLAVIFRNEVLSRIVEWALPEPPGTTSQKQ